MRINTLLPLLIITFIGVSALLTSCDSDLITKPCDTCDVPCDTCDTTEPCDTCDTTTHNPNDTTSHDFTWTEYTIPGEEKITGAWVWRDDLIQVIGTYFYQWDGVEWKKQKIVVYPGQTEAGFADMRLFCLDPNTRWMVGGIAFYSDGGTAFRYSGGGYACWGTAFNDMFFVGRNGYIGHFDGNSFTTFPKVTNQDLRSIWGTSSKDVWAADQNALGISVLLHYDGNTWREIDQGLFGGPAPEIALNTVWAVDSSSYHLGHVSGATVHRNRHDTPFWRALGAYPNEDFWLLYLMHGNSANDLMVGGGDVFAHWNGKTWKVFNELPGGGLVTFHMKGNTACVAGEKNGASWIAIGRRK